MALGLTAAPTRADRRDASGPRRLVAAAARAGREHLPAHLAPSAPPAGAAAGLEAGVYTLRLEPSTDACQDARGGLPPVPPLDPLRRRRPDAVVAAYRLVCAWMQVT